MRERSREQEAAALAMHMLSADPLGCQPLRATNSSEPPSEVPRTPEQEPSGTGSPPLATLLLDICETYVGRDKIVKMNLHKSQAYSKGSTNGNDDIH